MSSSRPTGPTMPRNAPPEDRKKGVVVFADCVADMCHYGHVRLFERARALGDYLIVGVCSDELVESYKRRPIMTYQERSEMVGALRVVDEVVLMDASNCPLTFEFLQSLKIDFVCHGNDFSPESLTYWYGVAEERGMMRLLEYTGGISTTDVISRIAKRLAESDKADAKKNLHQ